MRICAPVKNISVRLSVMLSVISVEKEKQLGMGGGGDDKGVGVGWWSKERRA